MKIGIVGSGAMGSVYGALLADAGNELWMFDKWQEHVDGHARAGAALRRGERRPHRRVNATTRAAEAGPCALAIVATKVMDIEAALREAAAMIGPDTLVLAIQNGLGNVERIQRALSAENLLFGIAGGFGAELIGPGHVHHNGMEAINLAELERGITARLESVAEVWRGPGSRSTSTTTCGRWSGASWSRTSRSARSARSPACGSARCAPTKPPGPSRAPASRRRSRSPRRRASGSPMTTRRSGSRTSPARSRTRARRCTRTCCAGRRSEIDAIHGGVVAEGAKVGVPTPTCALMVRLVKALEAKAEVHGDAYRAL